MTLLGGSGPSRPSALLGTTAVALLVLATAVATAATIETTFTALDGPDACGEDDFCWDVPVTGVAPNSTLNLTVVNGGQDAHNFYVDWDGDFDETNTDSDPQAAEANLDRLESGDSGDISFTVPADAEQLYIWCDIPGHEELGMFSFVAVGTPTGPPGEGEEGLVAQNVGVPLFSYWVGVIAIFAMLAWLAITFFVLRYESTHHTDHRDRKRGK